MWAHMNGFKEQCLQLRKAGHTLTEIAAITGRSKSSIYFHINQIPLSDEKIKSISLAAGVRARAIATLRKGVSERDFKKFNKWTKNTVLAVAHLTFDGTISRTSCVYNNREKVLIDAVEQGMKEIYDYEPKRYLNTLTGVSRIGYFNVTLSSYIMKKSKELLSEVENLPKELKKVFIRAFFDDEGCMDFRPKKNRRQIRGYQKDVSILFLIQKLLLDFGIDSKIVKPNEVVISSKENLIKYQKEIGFSAGIRRNENRSNSIWKKPLEKNELLALAINSFKS